MIRCLWKCLHITFITIIISTSIYSQKSVEIFPSELLVQPFTANTLKPKLGFEFKSSVNELSLNIGSSMDIVHYELNDNYKLSVGADLFTYTLLRSQSDFHFPVERCGC